MKEYVFLTKAEQEQVFLWGKQLYANKQKKGTLSPPILKGFDPVWLDVIGIAAEYVVAKYIGAPYSFELFDVRDHGDIQIDGVTLEIKTNRSAAGDQLKIPEWQMDRIVDRYVLVNKVAKLQQWEIVGWITKDEFVRQCDLVTFAGYEKHPMYVVHRSKLSPSRDLKLLTA